MIDCGRAGARQVAANKKLLIETGSTSFLSITPPILRCLELVSRNGEMTIIILEMCDDPR